MSGKLNDYKSAVSKDSDIIKRLDYCAGGY